MNALHKKIEEAEKEFNKAMSEAKSATDEAIAGLTRTSHEIKVIARYGRMVAAHFQRDIKNLGHVPSVEVSSERGTTKHGGAWPTDFDLFDENDGETESERRMWAARDSYDMREGK